MNSVGGGVVDTFEKEEEQGEDIHDMEAMCVRMNSLEFATSKVEDFALQLEPAFDIDQESALAGDRPFAGSIEVVKKCRGDAINYVGAHIVNRCLQPVYAALFVPTPSSSSTRVDTVCHRPCGRSHPAAVATTFSLSPTCQTAAQLSTDR